MTVVVKASAQHVDCKNYGPILRCWECLLSLSSVSISLPIFGKYMMYRITKIRVLYVARLIYTESKNKTKHCTHVDNFMKYW